MSLSFDDGEGASYGFKDKITFKDIVLNHLKRITMFASVEFRGGYWQKKQCPINIGNQATIVVNEEYVPDTREVYSNAVEVLADMLLPYFDKDMIKIETEFREQLKELYNEYIQKNDEDNKVKEFKDTKHKISYRDERVRVCRELFRELSKFLKSIDYLDAPMINDES